MSPSIDPKISQNAKKTPAMNLLAWPIYLSVNANPMWSVELNQFYQSFIHIYQNVV